MNITFTSEELATYADRLDNWYNERTIWVVTKFMDQFNHATFSRSSNPQETYHKLCKNFQEENPKPDWRNLL